MTDDKQGGKSLWIGFMLRWRRQIVDRNFDGKERKEIEKLQLGRLMRVGGKPLIDLILIWKWNSRTSNIRDGEFSLNVQEKSLVLRAKNGQSEGGGLYYFFVGT